MQRLGRLLMFVLALGLGAWTALATPAKMHPAAMAAQMDVVAVEMGPSTGGCMQCAGGAGMTGMTKDCLAPCVGPSILSPEEAIGSGWVRASYEPRPLLRFSGVGIRPDPYPPKLIILA